MLQAKKYKCKGPEAEEALDFLRDSKTASVAGGK